MQIQASKLPRSRARYESYLDAEIETGLIRSTGTVLTVSDAGLFVATELNLPAGSRVAISFQIPDFTPVRVLGLVMYRSTHHERAGLGIRFLNGRSVAAGIEALKRWYEEFDLP